MKLIWLKTILVSAVLVGVPVGLTLHAVWQERLDHDLITAIKERNADTIVSLLKQGADPNAREHRGGPVSVWQVVSDILLRFRYRNTTVQQQGNTALILAVNAYPNKGEAPQDRVNPVIAQVLLDAGADPNCRDENYTTALMYAVMYCPSQVQHLLDNDADVNVKDNDGDTPLMCVSNPSVVRLLLDRGADVNACDKDGDPVLVNIFRYRFGSPEMLRLLLDRGAKVNIKDKYGYTPLIRVAMYDDTACVRLLLERGADVDAQDKDGNTALWYAAQDTTTVSLLLKHGANPSIKNKEGHTVLWYANQNRRTNVVHLLKKAGAKE